MNPEQALERLREELRERGVFTEDRDGFCSRAGVMMLSLAPGVIVWIGREFRWPGRDMRLRRHQIADAAGAALLIASLVEETTETAEAPVRMEPL
ncbi:hypothetical protein ACIBH1_40815 [Nonomuraea sp. NPDC050663]|uniref:hypothetical protein n=1 Tax=Nonomuraea sp. NPDC050663 TaxID=3364370 RepID=UPI0037894F65